MKEIMVVMVSNAHSLNFQFLLFGRIFKKSVIHSLARRTVLTKFTFYCVIAVFIKMFF